MSPAATAASRSALLLRADAVCKFGLGRERRAISRLYPLSGRGERSPSNVTGALQRKDMSSESRRPRCGNATTGVAPTSQAVLVNSLVAFVNASLTMCTQSVCMQTPVEPELSCRL